jgi:polar amino acid transport system substrate-binding protein
MTKRTWMVTGGILGLVMVLSACAAQATPTPTAVPATATPVAPTATPSGPSPAEQITAGQRVYSNQCAGCHGNDLEGVSGPPLTASSLSRFSTAAGLYDYISTRMPANAPGSLSETDYYDVVAYLLDFRGLLPAGEAVTPDTAPGISLSQ